MLELQGKRVFIPRPDGTGYEGIVERVQSKWIYVAVEDPAGQTLGFWVNTDLQREIEVRAD